MAEGVSKTLEEILLKLGKLDSIEESVHNIETTLSKLEVRTSKLESFEASASKDIEDMKQGLNFLDNKVDSSLYKLENEVKRLQDKVEQSRSKETVYEEQIEELKIKDLYLEAYSRRENIKFMNIREEEDENVEAVIRGFLQDELNYSNYDLVEIQRIHRNGRRVGSKPRPILARFLRAKDCEEIISLGYKLKGTSYQMFRALPYELVKKRKLQMPTYKKARQNKIPAAFSKSEPDKLYIRGGWTIVKRTILQSTSPPAVITKYSTYDVISAFGNNDKNVKPLGAAMLDILNKMGFHQIHFYCHKKSVGRVVSIMTKNNTAGHQVVRYFTDDAFAKTTFPDACGSFERLPEDTSILAQKCDKWGSDNSGNVEVNKWGANNNNGPGRLPSRPFIIDGAILHGFGSDLVICDDNIESPQPLTAKDNLRISVR
ncbi:hypothetical protein QZH41_006931 [Actinostola sp. cb2023]|nr:hypothetical protein QZH41_006931 [Actinostola sp. cb2023]